jgi:HEAT repeat protein
MRSKGTLLLAGFGLLALAATSLLLWELDNQLASTAGPRPTWPSGTRYDYRLEWTADSEVGGQAADGAPTFTSKIDLSATVRLVSHGAYEHGWLLAASFVEVPKPDVALLGRPVFPDPAAARAELVGPTAWVVIDADGRVERVYFDASAPQAFKHLMQSVVGLAQITTGDGPSWSAVEPGPSGIARVVYERESATTWTRQRIGYDTLTAAPVVPNATPQLAARADITVDPQGHLATLVDNEVLTVRIPNATAALFHGTSRFALTLVDHGKEVVGDQPALAQKEVRTPGQIAQTGEIETRLREQRTRGMTREQLVEGLGRVWTLPSGSEKRRWLDQAAALLQLHPELCSDVLAAFHDGEGRERLFAFDLLASAGMPEAQAAMREALASPDAKLLAPELVQRFSLVVRPDADSARFVVDAWRAARTNGDADLASATTYTIGAVARHLAEDGAHAALVDDLDGKLRDALAQAATPRAREDALAALGNAAQAANVSVVREAAHDASPEVRSRAAWALRDTATPEARAALVELSSDADPRVARSALAALGRQPLAAADFASLEHTLHGPLADATAAGLIDLLGAHLDGGAPVRQMLESLAANPNVQLQARARVLLAQLN